MSQPPAPSSPSLPRRMTSAVVMGMTGVIAKCFFYGLNTVEVTGLPQFLELLDSRQDPEKRQRGLLTVSNHISIIDDPGIWGVLPLRYTFNPSNLRWTLGAHDICFKNSVFASFFTSGQVLPCHRLKHSPHGGLFQPSVTQVIRLLSSQPYSSPSAPAPSAPLTDPFAAGALTYTTTGTDSFPAPSAYARHRHSWVHIFPEGLVHQHPSVDVRYFKWGIARMILEAEPAPDVLPMFIDGTHRVMSEDRGFPRFVPRVGKTIRVAFGDVLDYEATFGDLRRRWRELARKSSSSSSTTTTRQSAMSWFRSSRPAVAAATAEDHGHATGVAMLGELPDDLKYGREAQEIRIEVARRMRAEVLKVRKVLGGYPDSDPALGDARTWVIDDDKRSAKYKSRVEGSEINQE